MSHRFDEARAAFNDGASQVRRSIRAVPITTRRVLTDPRSIVQGAPLTPLTVLFGHTLLDSVDRAGFAIILPEIQQDFDLDLQGVAGLAAISAVVGIVLSIPVAHQADRSHHRTAYLAAGALIAAVFSVSAGLATGLTLFILSRAAFGLGLQLNDPVQQSLLSDYYPVETRPSTFAGRQIAQNIGQLIGPLLFGAIAATFGWRIALLALAPPALLLAWRSIRLPEPARGAPERAALGLSRDEIAVEDTPPRLAEAVRLLRAVHTVRRLWIALPFLVGGVLGMAILLPLYLEETFGLGPVGRGAVVAVSQAAGIVGLLFGVPITGRFLLGGHPERVFHLLGGVGLAATVFLALVAAAPNIAILVLAGALLSFVTALVVPGFATLLSIVMPVRARTLGFALTGLLVLPGLLMLPVAGAVGDAYGLRVGMLVGLPLFLVGALIVGSAGSQFRADMAAGLHASITLQEATLRRADGTQPLLQCRSLDVRYGPVQVLFDLDLDIADGEIVALLGTNGAGKSTLLRAISGTLPVAGGSILYDGRDITQAGPSDTTALGVVQVPGGRGVFSSLSVAENLRAAAWMHRRDGEHIRGSLERAFELFPALARRWHTPAGELSGGEQQMLTIAQAFLARPRLLLIDELSLGLAPVVVAQLLEVVRAVNAEGVTIVVVEQSVNVALTVADRAIFLEKGEVRYEGPTAELLQQPDILRSVFLANRPAGEHPRASTRGAQAPTEATSGPALVAAGLTKNFGGIRAVDGVDLTIASGEIVGIIGANGAGKTTLFDLLSGFMTADHGTVHLGAQDVTLLSPDGRARAGLGRSFQDARLFPSLTVSETIAVAYERHLDVSGPLAAVLGAPAGTAAERAATQRVDELVELLGLTAFRDKFIGELSTGSRRIVDLACAMAHEPTVLLLDEPSSGIAQRETEALAVLLHDIHTHTGASMVLIEHDIPLISSVADRLVVLELGRVISFGRPSDVLDDPRVVASYLGTDSAAIARSGPITEVTPVGAST